MYIEKIFCISSGQLIVKKIDNNINRKNRYLNYGLLSLATILKQEGWEPVQVQGNFEEPIITLKKCISFGFDSSSIMPLLISIPSFYAISWAKNFIALAKEINPRIKIILGGRWVISNKKALMKKLIPEADIIVSGIADLRITKIILSCLKLNSVKPLKIMSGEAQYPSLDYSLLVERNLYQPSIEISRGCGMGCSFCQEKDEKRLPLKNSQKLLAEIQSTIIYDELNAMNVYFEASIFIPNVKWIKELLFHREQKHLNFNWRAESRVDTINSKYLEKLSKAGLKVLDLGLESASYSQLLKMKKTKNPEQYLVKASKLIKECYEHDIAVKVNILLYAGETEKTILETTEWLEKHQKYIKGVSVGSVIVYGWDSNIKEYLSELFSYGASINHSPAIGINHLNLSAEIDYESSIIIADKISSQFMTAKDYFDLKSFSYFSRDYTYASFIADIDSENGKYSFSIK